MGRNAQSRRGWTDERPERKSIPATRYVWKDKPKKAERQKPTQMTTDLAEQAELDAFYAGQRERLSFTVLDQMFNAPPRAPICKVYIGSRVRREAVRGWGLAPFASAAQRMEAHAVGNTILDGEAVEVGDV